MKGDVVIIPFPFSDLSGSKRRPALVLSDQPGDDIILCQITSKSTDPFAIPLDKIDFANGSLPISSFIRPGRIFTADSNIIIRKTGSIKSMVYANVVKEIHALIKE